MKEIAEALNFLFPGALSIQAILKGHLKLKAYKKGDTILNIGDIGSSYYYIYTGVIRTYCKNSEGTEFTLWFRKETEFFVSLDSYKNNNPSKLAFEAIENCKIIIFKKDFMDKLFKTNGHLMALYKDRIESGFIELESSIISSLTNDAKVRYENLIETYPYLIKRVPLMYIASCLGINQSTLSRIRSNKR